MRDEIVCREKRYCLNKPERCWMCERNEVNDVLEDCFDRRQDKPVKIHFWDGVHYICNSAVEPLEFKSTTDINKITCKRCLVTLNSIQVWEQKMRGKTDEK